MNVRTHSLGALALAANALLWWPDSASASDRGPTVALSLDGVAWGAQLSRPLFDPAVRWVPGDTRAASFWVRTGGATGASVRIEARDLTTGMLTARGDVVLHARVAGGAWVQLLIQQSSASLDGEAIPVHGTTRIDVRASFAPGSENRSHARTARLVLGVRLQDAGVEEPPSPGSDLPGIGAPAIAVPLLGGLLLVGAGVAVVRRAERRP